MSQRGVGFGQMRFASDDLLTSLDERPIGCGQVFEKGRNIPGANLQMELQPHDSIANGESLILAAFAFREPDRAGRQVEGIAVPMERRQFRREFFKRRDRPGRFRKTNRKKTGLSSLQSSKRVSHGALLLSVRDDFVY